MIASSRYPPIAREGWLTLLLVGAAAAVVLYQLGWPWSVPLWVLVGILLFLFRDPARAVPAVPLAVVSPADGRVSLVETCNDPYLDRDARRVSIRMHPYGVFSTRSPAEGKMLEPKRDASTDPDVPHGVCLQTDEGDELVIVMNRGPLRNPPRCYVGFGERVGQGQRCGFITLGSTVDIYLPLNSRIKVQEGDRVRAGADVIAQLMRS